jgi:hypothetical protein
VGFVVENVAALGQVFSEYLLDFPLPISISTNPPTSQSPEAGIIAQWAADVQSGLIWTPHPTMRI